MTFYCHAHRHARLPSFGQLKRVRIAQSLTPPPPAHSSITPMHPMSSPAPLSLAQRLPLAFLPCTLLPTVEWGLKASRLPAAGPGNPPIHPSVQCSALGGWWLRAGITRTHTLYPLFEARDRARFNLGCIWPIACTKGPHRPYLYMITSSHAKLEGLRHSFWDLLNRADYRYGLYKISHSPRKRRNHGYLLVSGGGRNATANPIS